MNHRVRGPRNLGLLPQVLQRYPDSRLAQYLWEPAFWRMRCIIHEYVD
ncbi:hypothetical protein SAMN03159444_01804 [Pseudomonas sp. NFACC02]|nr:hypothetical protein SAMN03159444_01804 [Pseudomonas sp. NFACC02]